MGANAYAFGRQVGMEKVAWMDGWSEEQDRKVYEKARRDKRLKDIDQRYVDRVNTARNAALLVGLPGAAGVAGLGTVAGGPALGLTAGGLIAAANLYGRHVAGKNLDRYKNDEAYRKDVNLGEMLARNPHEEGLATYFTEKYGG